MTRNRPTYRVPFGSLFLLCLAWVVYAGLVGYLPEPWNWIAFGVPVVGLVGLLVWAVKPGRRE